MQTNNGNQMSGASAITGSSPYTDQSIGTRKMERKDNHIQFDSVESQLALDEAVARALQDMENQFADASLSESSASETVLTLPPANRRRPSPMDRNSAARQDSIDPDHMTYEELQSLGDAIGTHGRGLSDELLSYLPSFKYKSKTGFFSKKEKHEECVICCMEYKNREMLTMLPCQHQYHSKCVNKWLKINKACPVCNEEVFG